MSCYYPNFMLFRHYKKNAPMIYGAWKHSKKNPLDFYKFLPHDTFDGSDYYKARFENNDVFFEELISIPCGNCVGCRMDYSKMWATRCYLESLKYEDNYFVTLTYDDKHLPHGSLGNATLVKADFEKFIKDVRNYWQNKFKYTGIRFFGAGEYGSTTFRPHYHVLLFNLPLPDLIDKIPYVDPDTGITKIESKVVNGSVYYWSEILSKIWSKGQVIVGKLNYRTCAYTARYVVKKAKGQDKKDMIERLDIVPEFVRMSNRPGIGADYCLSNLTKLIQDDHVLVPTGDNVVQNSLPRYFLKLIEALDSDSYDELHLDHQLAIAETLDRIDHQFNGHYFDYLKVKERNHISKLKALNRSI